MTLNLDKTAWKTVAFGDVVRASKEKVDPADGSLDRYVAGEHMDSDDLKIHRWGDTNEVDLGPAFHRRFRPGQVLYGSRRTYLRKVAVADFDGVCANTTFVLETSDRAVLAQDFLPFVMSSEPFHAFAIAQSKGSVNPYVNFSDLAKFEFDLPPLDEQKRIADLLWSVERCLLAEKATRAALLDARTAWVDSEVFSFLAADHVAFADVWAHSPESGYSAAPVGEPTGRFVLSLSALGAEGYQRGHLKNVPDTEQTRRATLQAGDLLVSRANTIDAVGRAGIYPEKRNDVSFPDTMMRLRLSPTVSAPFAGTVIASSHGKAHMRRHAAGSATSMVKINRASLGKLKFPVVSGAKQEAFLRELSAFDDALAGVDSSVLKLRAQRAALLADVLGGH